MPLELQQFGHERSGTYVTKQILEHNLVGVTVHETHPDTGAGAHKHDAMDHQGAYKNRDGFVLSTRNPYSQVAATLRYHVGPPDTRAWSQARPLVRPIVYGWAARNRSWLQDLGSYPSTKPLLIVRLEDLLGRVWYNVVENARELYDVRRVGTLQRPTHRAHDPDTAMDLTYETEHRYLDDLGTLMVNDIRTTLNRPWIRDVLGRLLYDVEPPGDSELLDDWPEPGGG